MHVSARTDLHRWIVLALLVAAVFLGAAAWASDGASSFVTSTRVMLFEPNARHWALATFAKATPGSEFLFDGKLYRVSRSGGAHIVPGVSTGGLFEADRCCDETSRPPKGSDVVQLLDNDQRFISHMLFSDVKAGCLVRFQGRTYNVTSEGVTIVFSSAADRDYEECVAAHQRSAQYQRDDGSRQECFPGRRGHSGSGEDCSARLTCSGVQRLLQPRG